MLSLDSYGREVLERLKNCNSDADIWGLLAEANEALHGSLLSAATRRMFWQTLQSNLEVVVQDAPLLLQADKAALLSNVVRIAESEIQLIQQLLNE